MRSSAAALLAVFAAGPAAAQQAAPHPWHVDFTVHDVGIGIGNSPHIDGLRLNFRDTAPFRAHGVNATVWLPADTAFDSEAYGVALGLPVTGAGRVRGLALGFGVGADKALDGVAAGVLGIGSGGGIRGIAIAGLGAGTGGDVIGIAVGGLGAGAGRNVYGVVLGGLGAGAGGDFAGIGLGGLGIGAGGNVRGVFAGGLGVGAGGDLDGIALGGLGVGTGGRLRGIAFGGLGAGVGGDVQGILVGGLGVGAGGDVRGLLVGGLAAGGGGAIHGAAIAGLGAGAPTLRGLAAAALVGGKDIEGLVLAPAYFHLVEGGRFAGVSVSAFNRVLGEQRGVAIGIVNYAARLHGVQIGLVNWADNNPAGLKVLPVANAHFE